MKTNLIKQKAITLLKTIYDPEVPVNIWDLGLIYSIEVLEGLGTYKQIEKSKSMTSYNLRIIYTLTSPNCPGIQSIPAEIEETLRQIPEVNEVYLSLTWDPKWTKELMSDEVKLELGLL